MELGKPIVFTIRDMHPLTGGCHFFHGCDNWKLACLPCPQFLPEDIHLPHATFDWKRCHWDTSNVAIVVLSEHSRRIVEASPLFTGCDIQKIPNPIDIEVFRPTPKHEARSHFGIPEGKRVIAYLPSFRSKVKGRSEFEQALSVVARRRASNDVVIVTAGFGGEDISAPFPKVDAGHIDDKQRLAAFYSAADVTVVPSLEETFSNTAAESIACGTPVVGFQTGAIPELASGVRGAAVPIGDVLAFADAVTEMLKRTSDHSEECHSYIAANYSPELVGGAYLALFDRLVEKRRRGELLAPPRLNRLPSSSPDPSSLTVRYLAVRLSHAEKARGSAAASQVGGKPSGHRVATADDVWFARQAFTATAKLGVLPFTMLLLRTVANRFGRRNSGRSWVIATVRSKIDTRVTIPPPEDFDDDLYLQLNRDVAQAIESGAMASGFFHYVRYGAKEGRPRPNRQSDRRTVDAL